MDASGFFQTKVKKAKNFGFPEPIYINSEKLTGGNRVIYLVEIQAMHIADTKKGGTHHFSLKFSKFKKIKEEPYWVEEDLTPGFFIKDKSSIEKLSAYIKTNQSLLNIDVLSKDFTSVLLSSDDATINVVRQILSSKKNRSLIYELFKEQYPELDKKILVYKLVEERKKTLRNFDINLNDPSKSEQNYWQPFLKENRWMFGLSFVIPLDDTRVDLWNITDYLFKSSDGFIDIVEIKHPFVSFWQRGSNGALQYYRGCLVPSEELKKSITQATNYVFQLEKKFSDPDWQKKNNCDAPVKPTCTVVLGRSNDWDLERRTSFRLLNDSLHGVEVITFDYLLDCASRLLKILEGSES